MCMCIIIQLLSTHYSVGLFLNYMISTKISFTRNAEHDFYYTRVTIESDIFTLPLGFYCCNTAAVSIFDYSNANACLLLPRLDTINSKRILLYYAFSISRHPPCIVAVHSFLPYNNNIIIKACANCCIDLMTFFGYLPPTVSMHDCMCHTSRGLYFHCFLNKKETFPL